MLLIELFWSFFQIGLFSFGGGMASLPLIQKIIIAEKGWLTLKEFTDLLTISQMTPGPIAINASTFVGTQVAGLPGAIVATLGCIAPSCIIISLLAYVYFRYKNLSIMQAILGGLRPAIVSLIATAGMSVLTLALWNSDSLAIQLSQTNISAVIFIILSLLGMRFAKLSPIAIIILTGIAGVIVHYLPSLVTL